MTTEQTRAALQSKPNVGYRAAVSAGLAICDAARRVGEECLGDDSRTMARVACLYALDNLWYDRMTNAAKEKFNFDRQALLKLCGWPD